MKLYFVALAIGLSFAQTNENKGLEKLKKDYEQGVEKIKASYKAYEEKRQVDYKSYRAKRDSAFKSWIREKWHLFLELPNVSLPKSPDSLKLKSVEIPKIKPDENPNIEIINALLKEGINEKQAVNIALEIIDSLGTDAIKEGQSIGIFTEDNEKEKPAIVSYMVDSSQLPTFIRSDKTDGYKYFESKESKVNKKNCFTTKSQYVFPLKGSCRKTSGFGMREHPILKKPKRHNGTDYGTAKGSNIYAIADGIVTESSWTDINGYYVAIKHADGMLSYYLHLNEKGIAKSSSVKADQIIGQVGSTGRSTGPHLHLGINKNGEWRDPENVLGIAPAY